MQRSELAKMIEAAGTNPMAVQRASIEYLERVTNNEIQISDPSNAFVYLMEMASTMYTNIRRKDELLNMRQYPELANSRMDLYHHMSDEDYLNIFSTPASANLFLIYSMEEVMAMAVETGVNDIKKLVIPRFTKIKAGDLAFTLQYPIEIRVLPHGGIQVVYDNHRPTPIQVLETNMVNWSVQNYNQDRVEFLQMAIPMPQVEIKTYTAPMTAIRTFSKNYKYTDRFYYARAYVRNEDGSWQEIHTTHSDLVYDPNKPTACLKLLDNNVINVSIPQVYFTNGSVTRTLRVDIYTTKGPLDLAIQSYSTDMFSIEYSDIEGDDDRRYTSPATRLTTAVAAAEGPVTGGSLPLSFEKLKERVIFNALSNHDLPVTNVQLQSQLDMITELGFSIETKVDNVTRRIISASRELPIPAIREISTGIGSNVVTLGKSIEEILLRADVADNGERVTVLPSTLYRDMGGYLDIVDSIEREAILGLPKDVLIDRVNNEKFLYTPFHYVYDTEGGVFEVRPYYFGNPEIKNRYFVTENGTLGVGIATNQHRLQRTETGWVLQVMTSSTDSLKELDDDAVVAQLAFIPHGEVTRTYLNATLLGRDPQSKEWIFEFRFDSNWDVGVIEGVHRLYLNGFSAEGIAPHAYPTTMESTFDIMVAVRSSQVQDGERSEIDDVLGQFLVNDAITGLYHEQLTIKLGSVLDGLWARARSTIGQEQYLRHETDVPMLHTVNKPLRDPVTGAVVLETGTDGRPKIVYEHRVGDPVTIDGEPQYIARAGEVVLENGMPVLMSPRNILRRVELVLFDGIYYFVNNGTDVSYRDSVPEQIVQWVNHTLKPIRQKLLENTILWFHPKSTVGQVPAIVNDGLKVNLDAAQRLLVELYVTPNAFRDESLKNEIRRTTRQTITQAFRNSRVTRNGIAGALKAAIGDDVVEVGVRQLGGMEDYDVVTMEDNSARLCIGKKLVQLPNATLGVEDAIDIVFLQHIR